MMFQAILLALAPVFFVMALGYGAGRLGVVDHRHVDGFNALVMDFALPASIFVATASAPRDETLAQAPLFAILGGVMLAVYLGWYAFARISGGAAARLILSAQSFRPDWKVIGATIMGDVVRPLLTAAVVFTLAVAIALLSPF
ncbi:Auxin Efflux Carrier [Ancylobacter novellus DSM 506]|uniref:Auxin Efflux Carrier n=1 Tax=Ancylobacter novellus (strain ATCC 8093 / DSM 506 / JCM 20403 / CCM 1077 / IAM 12100 / NBRC 12443 / NCIMB 10456) TaxID=639283 RepID=D7AA26_ANCN5|nr:AEC family transporter [Ancylobacter novellus]ADH90813.1 Auxin Efflux Carrier [Ancylobacter novellus DSM 506]